MADLISVDALNETIKNALDEYNEAIVKGLKRETTRGMQELVKVTKATAPVGHRSHHYKNSIASKTLKDGRYGIEKLWYVRGSDYRLSHLLNNGHAKKNGGFVPGTNFIGNATDQIISRYVPKIEEVIRNGQ